MPSIPRNRAPFFTGSAWVEIEGACRQAFALGGCTEISDEHAFAAVNTYALAYARAHVLGDQTQDVVQILDGSRAVSPLATYMIK